MATRNELLRTIATVTLLSLVAPSNADAPRPVPRGSRLIQANEARLKADMTFLADDLLEGREAGTRADALSQLYIRTQFEAADLAPAGEGGTYLQPIRVRATVLDVASSQFEIIGTTAARRFANGDEIAMFGSPTEADQRVEAALVFAGYGIVAPEYGIDDYRTLDAKGKIVVVIGGPPSFLPAAEAAHFGSGERQRREAARRGAIGVLHLWSPALEQRFPFDGLKALLGRVDLNWLHPDGTPQLQSPGLRLSAFARGAAADAVFEGAPKGLADVMAEARTASPKGFALATRLTVARKSRHDDTLTTANVAGTLAGSDPKLKNEVVVLTAHFDHVGIGEPVKGDRIYNGALDNSVGTAMLIELARQVAAMPERPKRSIVFLAVAAEEKGLIGSDYFAERPTVPIETIVANINLDGAMPFYDFSDVIAFGAEQSEIGGHLSGAAAELGLAVAPDPFPAEGIFTRSDQYSFVKRGVPSVFLYMGFTDMEGRNVGREMWDELGKVITHQPADDLQQPIDYAVVAKFADVFRRLTLRVANAERRPQWHETSIFGEHRDHTQ